MITGKFKVGIFALAALVGALAIPAAAEAQVLQCQLLGRQQNCSGPASYFGASPSGAAGNATMRQIVALDLPAILGDVTGPYSATVVARLRGVNISTTAPTMGQFLGFDGMSWTPTTLASMPPSGPAGGDLFGAYPNPSVGGFRGVSLLAGAPAIGQAYVYNGTQFSLQTVVTATGPGSTQTTAISDTAATACQIAKRVVATGHVAVATGVASVDGDFVIGLYTAAVAVNGQAVIAKIGSTVACPTLPNGRLYRSATGNLDLYSAMTPGDYSNFMAVTSSAGAQVDVVANDIRQVAP